MFLLLIKLLLSLAAIIISADWMTSGASAVAMRMRIPPFIVGLTIVAMGTSAPELFVSVSSALKSISEGNAGMGDIAIGNVVGSNIFNNLMIIGAVSLIAPLTVSKTTVKRDLPIVTLSSVMLLLFLWNGSLSRIQGAFFLVCFILYMWWTVKEATSGRTQGPPLQEDGKAATGAGQPPSSPPASPGTEMSARPVWQAVGLIAIGLAILVKASDLFVESASGIAQSLGVTEKIIGLTIVGAGTSAPELATSVMAARKGQGAMAIGNVIGSNIFNILMILGLTGLIQPLSGLTINYIDLGVLIVAALLFWIFSFTKYKLERWEGAVLLGLCLGYIIYLIISS